jgi:hypothetical protein
MNSTKLASIGLAAALAAVLPAIPAQAQVNRTFVSAAGSDSNNCANVATPCRHFAAAFAATAASGEIFVLDPANYGSLTITHAVSIEGHGWASIAPPNNGNAITVNAGSNDSINIHGVAINGTGASGNTNGIVFNSGYKLAVIDCFISNFTQDGIFVNVTATTTVLVSNAAVSDTPGGVVLQTSGNGAIIATINHSTFDNNADSIELMNNGSHDMTVIISNSTIGADTNVGIYAIGNPGLMGNGIAFLTLKNVTFTNMVDSIYLAGHTGAALSEVTRPSNAVDAVFCIGDGNTVQSDLTNHMNYDASCGTIITWHPN